ncbi:L-galactose dehydrogenase [Streptoalloteichus tenebrarius]|uniref:L-galactose dehydrogenase n=1 Tax=Streptoalloteichus tenebrarius (strain ATCC 17920 / DSM 40477 / JCM 4838 / CBS 697.72 / NBRC 16177 / NCIMB 11028 / NRRL B-12390 / A12253. 1 / ISP 5477) TaxID=1933 RepID=A0ABT1HZP7_STRSD|nr:aldo/keto reductase [Streptoalloteichus tenebrarius]MCP2260956.1 L-galactose dehydrogenase [Streptoalloteichus tenebrarius]BFE98893.1 aldo/keto reductase [Streptoalloteichus tenebrarius]
MRHRRLGRTGLAVSALGLGTTAFRGTYPRRDPDEASRALRLGLDLGITVVDTGPSCGAGVAEEMTGRALRGRRNEVVLVTRVGCHAHEEFDLSPRRIRQELAHSLRRLGTDHVDVLLAHGIEFGEPERVLGQVLPLLADLRREGLARAVGVSGLVLPALTAAVETGVVDVVLSYCRFGLHDQAMAPAAERWRERGVGIVLGGPVAMGLLTAAGPPRWHPASPGLRSAARHAAALCAEHGVDLAFLAMQYALTHSRADCVLTGTGRTEHLLANLRALETPLDEELLAQVLGIFAAVRERTWPSGDPRWREETW